MKKILAWVLVLVMVVGLFAGCHNTNTTEPTGAEEYITAEAAMEYLKALYKTGGEALKTPRDYERYGVIRVGGEPFTVVWTVEGADGMVKVVTGDGEMVTIDVDEQCQEDTPYTLTATITDKGGNSLSYTWDCVLPKALDVGKVLEEAYALADGETLPYEVTLTGKVTMINTMYNAEYQNITVTMVVEGYEQYPIECYRLKGEGVENLQVGNIITVTGTIKNYKGKIEFDQGCILEKVEKGDAVDAPTDPLEIVAAAFALKDGESLPYVATLTGKVVDIESPYDPDYGNITVAIEVAGAEGKHIVCYRLKGTGVDQIAIDDTITVMGIIKNYKGKIEFDSGCVMTDRISGGRVAEKPSTDPVKIMADAAKLGWGEHLNYYATLTGKVTDIESPYDSAYKNITVVISVDGYANMPITCYRLKGNGVEKIARGDIITVKGIIENYKGKLEFGSGCTLLDRLSGGGVAKPETAHTATIMADAAKLQSGQHLDYYSSLTGVVTEIESPYDASYGNITVIMTVAGYEGMPITCYRLKSGAYSVASIAVGDTITVRGVLENYKGKLEYGTGCTLSYRKSGGNVAKPESSDAASILADALALEDGQKLSYYANLTGKVTEIDSPYDKNYGNISVIMEVVNGDQTISMLCYRLKSGAYDVSKIAVGDTITVRGVIENYKGEIQFGSGSTLTKRVSGGGVAKPESSDEAAIMADAAALEDGQKLDYYANLTGKVTSIKTWYDPNYGNVTLYIELSDGTSLYCYRMKSGKADASQVRVGDTITVRGVIENYKGEVQMGTGCTVEKLVKGENPGDNMTAAQIMEAAYALASGESLEGAYELTGVITKIDTPYSSQYKNITVTMEVEGKSIQCYRLASGAADVSGLQVGDTITVYGNIINYNGKVQFNQGCVLLACVPGEGSDTPDTPVEGAATVVIYNPSSGKALSSNPSREGSYYLGGVDVSANGTTLTGFGATEQWAIVDNGDGTYSFNYGGKNLAMGASFTSTPLGDVNDKWKVIDAGDGLYYIENTVRTDFRLQWRAGSEYNYFSGYQYNNTGDNFKFAFYVIEGTLPNFGEGGNGGNTDPDQPDQPDQSTDGASLDFKDLSNRVSHSAEQQVWQQNGITMTNDKAGSSTDNFDGSTNNTTHVRWYTGANITVEYPGMTRIVFDVAFSDRVDALADSLKAVDGATVTVNDLQVTVDFAEADSLTFAMVLQTRVTGLTVYTGTTPPSGGDDNTGDDTNTDNTPVETPVVGEAYKWAIDQETKGVTLYFAGEMDGHYGKTTQNISEAVDMKLEETEGGYYLSFTNADGAVKYINMVLEVDDDKTYRNLIIADKAETVYTYSDEYKTLIGVLNDEECYFGTYGSYITFSVSTIDKISTSYPSYFCIPGEGSGEGSDTPSGGNVSLENGDQVVIFAPAYNKALSTTKTGYYNVGVDVTVSGDTLTGYTDAEVFTVIANADGSYSFANGGQNIGLAAEKSSMNLGAINDKWTLESLGNGLYLIKNVGRSGFCMEWYNQYSNWSTYNSSSAASDDQFQLSFYVVGKGIAGGSGNGGDEGSETPSTPPSGGTVTGIANGDQVVIYAPAYNKALSTTKTGYYNVGVDVTVSGNTLTGYTDAEVFTVIANADGSYSFANGGQNIGLAAEKSSMNLGAINDKWTLESLGNGLYLIKNVGRSGFCMEWYNQYSNWSTYNSSSAASDDQFQLSFYVVGKGVAGDGGDQGGETPDEPVTPPSGGTVAGIANGDQVVIYAPAYNKALSTTKTGYYNVGVDVTVSGNTLTGYTDAEVFTVIANADGSYSFANGGQNIGLAAEKGSMNLGAINDKWTLESLGNGLYLIKNVGRSGFCMEWYNQYSNWSTYNSSSAASDDQFQLSFYVIGKGIAGDSGNSGSGDNSGNEGGSTTPETPVVGEGVTISFADLANRVSISTQQQKWQQNGITVTNDKGSSPSNVNGDFYNPIRCYKSSSLTVEYTGMKRIVFKVGTYTGKDYAADLISSLEGIDGITVSRDGVYVTVDFNTAVNSLFIATLAQQVRLEQITVYTAA